MTETLKAKLAELSEIQRTAAEWGDGPALVLAGPGSGKTRVLTARIARLLHESQPRKFRVLALTFTTKAANEMKERVQLLVPDQVERCFIGTFHAFCATVLRQHGSHIGLQPDFNIYSEDADRRAVLVDAADAAGLSLDRPDDFIKLITRLKQDLIIPEKTAERYKDADVGARVAALYAAYEEAMRRENRMDFDGLILETCRLVAKTEAVAQRLRQTYPYWLIDEFQDTSRAQYRMLRAMAKPDFQNIFAVADDDQIIYQWAGASYRQLEQYREHFNPTLIQLVENHRCPASVVAAANLLVAHNTQRTPNKSPLVPKRPDGPQAITLMTFDDDAAEAEGIATSIAAQDVATRKDTAVIARGRAQLTKIAEVLQTKSIKAVVAERRGRFVSPQFVWLQACLELAQHPADRRMFLLAAEAAERTLEAGVVPETIADEAEAAGISYLEQWAQSLTPTEPLGAAMKTLATTLIDARGTWKSAVSNMIAAILTAATAEGVVALDVEEDHGAWRAAELEIRKEKNGDPDLAEFLQGLALRSKTPPQHPDAVSLLTVHASKGLEFDHVYVVGLAESVFPSFQSVEKGDTSAEMEEERRNCFVAVTRTKKTLVLSRASRYRGWQKQPSRFLTEMGCSD